MSFLNFLNFLVCMISNFGYQRYLLKQAEYSKGVLQFLVTPIRPGFSVTKFSVTKFPAAHWHETKWDYLAPRFWRRILGLELDFGLRLGIGLGPGLWLGLGSGSGSDFGRRIQSSEYSPVSVLLFSSESDNSCSDSESWEFFSISFLKSESLNSFSKLDMPESFSKFLAHVLTPF